MAVEEGPPVLVTLTPERQAVRSTQSSATPPSMPAVCQTPAPGARATTDATPIRQRLLPPQGVIEPKPFSPLPLQEDAALLQRLKAVMGPASDSTSFVVKDLQTGRGASFNAQRAYDPASLFKLFVMYEVFHQESLGLVKGQQQLVLTPYYEEFALGPRRTKLCQVLTVDEALQAVMSMSDNAAAVLLQDLVG
ncbi:MAG TPA: serine hydrolase, partial [Dehalococcoidia bacterium]|nr:serine hydrolase [Dehalococcoidia bacterium]